MGTEWDLEFLEKGECVAIWGNEDKDTKEPEGIDCTKVGEPLERHGKRRFWEEAFLVYYGDRQIGACKKNEDLCIVSFVIP